MVKVPVRLQPGKPSEVVPLTHPNIHIGITHLPLERVNLGTPLWFSGHLSTFFINSNSPANDWHELNSVFPHLPKSCFGGLPPKVTPKVYLLSCAPNLLHEDDPLDSLQHQEQRGICLTTGFVGIGSSENSDSHRSLLLYVLLVFVANNYSNQGLQLHRTDPTGSCRSLYRKDLGVLAECCFALV
ncbi:hypothetical protein MA16_Dca014110 [Dendrobium catenatum]|uniref:Uncharacterized protein n=1 Tax=Dendrobium catenatum TaxID=906689 RepID=A0A2I0VS69_9ASPA|nr:hypothetical protein MA16_Dca014110 [Dendrobium catenatum]